MFGLSIEETRIRQFDFEKDIKALCQSIQWNGARYVLSTIKSRKKGAVNDPYFIELELMCKRNEGKEIEEFKDEVTNFVYRLATR